MYLLVNSYEKQESTFLVPGRSQTFTIHF